MAAGAGQGGDTGDDNEEDMEEEEDVTEMAALVFSKHKGVCV